MAESPGFLGCIKTRELKILVEKRQFLRIAKNLCATFVALFAFAITPAFATLPTGYTELEYIESTGIQYIDSGIAVTPTTAIKAKFQVVSVPNVSGDYGILGALDFSVSSARGYFFYMFEYYTKGNPLNMKSFLGSQYKTDYVTDYNVHVLDVKANGDLYLDDVLKGTGVYGSSSAPSGVHIGIFKIIKSDGGTMAAQPSRFYSVTIDNGAVRGNFIPAKRDSDGVLGMYDLMDSNPVTAFHTNAGSGTFTAGPATCRNLFDKNAVTANGDGVSLSDYIPVVAGQPYYIGNRGDVALLKEYNAGKQRIQDLYLGGHDYTPSVNTAFVRLNVSNSYLDTFQFEAGSTATDYVPFCSAEIKIATTSYNDAAFAPVEQALESAVTTIKDVVANTIVQADAIQNLQDTKQTMPDASGTNGTCPRFRQCLLIETDDGTPQWFQIIDPFKDFVTPILANNDHITPVDAQRRFYGDDDLCRMLPQTDDEATNTGIAKCTEVANAKNTATDNPEKGNLKQTEWGYEFKAADIGANPATDNPNNDEGIVYGISKCVSTDVPAGTYAQPATSTQLNNALWNARPTTMAGAGKYRRCWCKATSVAYGGQYYETSNAPWVFYDTYGSAASCVYACTADCASLVRNRADFRSAVLGWAVE